jgi:hypothetical protein
MKDPRVLHEHRPPLLTGELQPLRIGDRLVLGNAVVLGERHEAQFVLTQQAGDGDPPEASIEEEVRQPVGSVSILNRSVFSALPPSAFPFKHPG